MGKKEKFDFIRDVEEHANHNFHESFWYNKIDSLQLEKMRASLAISVIEFVFASIIIILVVVAYISDPQDVFLIPLALVGAVWWISLLRSKKWFELKKNKPKPENPPKEKKKKLPKRPKNYGRD